MIRKLQIYLFCLLAAGMYSCSVTRHLEEDEVLLRRVRFAGVNDNALQTGLRENVGVNVNKRILGFYPFYLQAWNFGKDGRDTAILRKFVREKIGESPTLLDSNRLKTGSAQLELFLFNNGYFNAEVGYSVKKRRKKAFVTYHINLNEPYSVGSMEYRVYDRNLHKLILQDTAANKVKRNQLFNSELLSDERDRITNQLRNSGYYFFSKEYISFDVDSNRGNFTVDMAMEVKNPSIYGRHEVYRVNEVYVDILYKYYLPEKDDSTFIRINDLNVRTRGMPIQMELFEEFVRVKSGELYSDQSILSTYNRLFGLQIFGNVRIESRADTANKLVDVFVYLTPDPAMRLGIEPQLITSDQSSAVVAGNQRIWGLSGQLLFRNRNLFHGAELLDVSYVGAAEFQYSQRKFSTSNVQQSLSTTLSVPKFLWIGKMPTVAEMSKKQKYRNMTTSFGLSFTYQYNPDFIQRTSLINWIYGFGTGYNYFRIIPFEWNLNQVNLRSDFIDRLTPGDRILLSSLLNPNFIPSSRFEWYYEDKGLAKSGNYHKSRLTFEPAGNLFYTGFVLSGTPKPNDGVYKVFGTNLFQFVKTDLDLRYYMQPNPDVKLAYRIHAGFALPYGNSRVVPFDKRFFIGGANSLRGWAPRSIGPGNYSSVIASQIDRSGEILLEGSAEVRFRVIDKLLEGALFADAGNIWNVHADTTLPGAEINWLFLNQLAMNVGVGARFDFSFFLVRLDLGAQIRDPSYSQRGGWVIRDYDYLNRRLTLNFGIGYPF